MKELFVINSGRKEPGKEKLSLRFGERHCSYAVTDLTGNELYELVYCSMSALNENDLSAFRSTYPRIAEPYTQVQVTMDYGKAALMPSYCYRSEEGRGLLRIMHGDTYGSHVIAEPVNAWQIHNLYCTPRDVQDWLYQQYPSGVFRHQYSVLLKSLPALAGGCILADFRPSEFSVMAGQGGKILLAQTAEYEAPADVLFRLLKICHQFGLDTSEVVVRVSGLIEKGSALFQDLEQYFLYVEMREASWKESAPEYPAQFFTSLNDLALCAS